MKFNLTHQAPQSLSEATFDNMIEFHPKIPSAPPAAFTEPVVCAIFSNSLAYLFDNYEELVKVKSSVITSF